MVRKEEERQADDERWQVQEQAAEETQPEYCLSKQTDQTELVALDIIDFMSQDVFYVNQNDMLNDDPCRKESQKEPELKETDCCIQQVDCSHAQNEQKQIAPLQLGAQINLAQDSPATLPVTLLQLPSHETPSSLPLQTNLEQERVPESLSGASFQLQLQISPLQFPFQSDLAQKEQTETNSAIDPTQTAHAHKEQMVFQAPKPKDHAD